MLKKRPANRVVVVDWGICWGCNLLLIEGSWGLFHNAMKFQDPEIIRHVFVDGKKQMQGNVWSTFTSWVYRSPKTPMKDPCVLGIFSRIAEWLTTQTIHGTVIFTYMNGECL